jgi:predicted esterase
MGRLRPLPRHRGKVGGHIESLPSEHTIATPTHGRYLVLPGQAARAATLLGFHGYGETAEDELRRLQTVAGINQWTVVSIEGLHHFYRRRTDEVVASWMTRQNRELAIADNIAYVQNIVDNLSPKLPAPLALSGFSQGVAMAFRAAARLTQPVKGVIACGGDVPPELDANALARIPRVVIIRGVRDEWYTSEKQAADQERLRAAGVTVQNAVVDAGHEWTAECSEIASQFLAVALN